MLNDPRQEIALQLTRRHFFGRAATGIGTAALASLLNPQLLSAATTSTDHGVLGQPHFTPSAKRVIYLFMSGAPSQIDLFDYKPAMNALFDQDLPESIRQGQRLTTMTSGQNRFPDRAFDFQVCAVRRVRCVDERATTAHGRSGR